MNGSLAIEHNREALKRIVAMLVATFVDFAGLAPPPTSPLKEGRRSPDRRVGVTDGKQPDAWRRPPRPELAEGGEVGPGHAAILPRHLYFAILHLLRPAEAAARRLIIAAARGLVVPLPALHRPEPKPKSMVPLLRRLGLAVRSAELPATARRPGKRGAKDDGKPSASRVPNFPLLDPPRRPLGLDPVAWSRGRRHVASHSVPRILVPGFVEPSPLPAPSSPHNHVDATHLGQRLAALSAALDDLPGQAMRFARLKARREAMMAQKEAAQDKGSGATGAQDGYRDCGRWRRFWPLRRGRPPGGRLVRYDPNAAHPRNVREVDEILAHAHALALFALKNPDTS